jgi:phosphoserine phosphatase
MVPRTISESAAAFIERVLRLRPHVAVFDADGTLWNLDSGQQFFYWELEQRLVGDDIARWAAPRYQDYLAGRVGEAEMCGEMVTIHAGLKADDLERAAEEFFRAEAAAKIFPEMMELTHRLAQQGCELWAVSSTNEWVVRAGVSRFGIAADHVLAAAVAIENGRATDRLLRVPTDGDKAVVLQEALTGAPDAAFGNSLHDLAMLEVARHAFVVNPNADLEAVARARGWVVYTPEAGD